MIPCFIALVMHPLMTMRFRYALLFTTLKFTHHLVHFLALACFRNIERGTHDHLMRVLGTFAMPAGPSPFAENLGYDPCLPACLINGGHVAHDAVLYVPRDVALDDLQTPVRRAATTDNSEAQ
eukprot:NODE_12694_length_1209_cov_1.765250.p2 GENE.NODE_12694_length_1209_cov_1.765250~~NODE_12694_length_1209_cov_1.765250.p2  ORF type:complete len:123 (-),score=1.56 NODE_12694_length_1209_cov_1.765250:386-754(-)